MTDNRLPDPSTRDLIRKLPRAHIAIATIAAATIFFALLLPSGQVQANRSAFSLPADLEWSTQRKELANLPEINLSEPTLATESTPNWQELTVQKGDNLAKIFDRAGASAAEMQQILDSGNDADNLRKIFPGQKFSFQLDTNGQLMALRYEENQLNSTEIRRAADNFVAEKISREPDVESRAISGTITSSLYKAAREAGLSDAQIIEFAKIFGSEVDFALDIRSGDTFSVLYQEHLLDGKKIGAGAILAASFTNQGETHTAYRYVAANGDIGYFSAAGTSMRKAFMRAPLDFLKVTSSFNMHRFHPLLKIVRPHRGIDYGAPVGTPVYAAGDGRIVQSGFSESQGNFIVIQHSSEYTTKYLHLSKRNVSVGTRVRQGQNIGAVGSTGYATGPHLHYEFLVSGVYRDPRMIAKTLPKAAVLAGAEKQRFAQQIANAKQQLAALSSTGPAQVATADAASANNSKL